MIKVSNIVNCTISLMVFQNSLIFMQSTEMISECKAEISVLQNIIIEESKFLQLEIENISNYLSVLVESYPSSDQVLENLQLLEEKISPYTQKKKKFCANGIKILKSLKFILLNPEDQISQFFYSRTNTKKRAYSCIYSLNVLTRVETEVHRGNKFSNTCLTCKINLNSTFLYIGSKGKQSKILDYSQENSPVYNSKSVSSSVYNHYQGCFALLHEKIFFFGGTGKNCEYFDLQDHKWHEICELPFQINAPSCCKIKENILILSKNSKNIILYDAFKDSFRIIECEGLCIDKYKICMNFNEELVVIENEKILKFRESDFVFEVYKIIRQRKKETRVVSDALFINNSVYFLNTFRKILKFVLDL